MAIEFVALGRPATAGSKRGIPIRMKTGKTFVAMKDDSGDRGTSWRGAVASAARDAMQSPELLSGPLRIEIRFYRARPKSHYRTGKFSHELKPDAPYWPTTAPDVDKMSRAIFDALKGVVYGDDAQIVVKEAVKRYGTPERAEVKVQPLENAIDRKSVV